MTKSTFHVIAHRGDCAHAPENTVPAFDLAVKKGAHGIETDVRVTKDGVPVLLHDASLKRTAGIDVPLETLTWAEASRLDAGQYRGAQFAGTRLPRLDEFLTSYLPRISLQLELKAAASTLPMVELLRRHDAMKKVLVTSFETEYLHTARAAEPELQLGWLLREPQPPAAVKALGCTVAIPNSRHATPEYVRELRSAGLRVEAWAVHDLSTARAIVKAGVEAATYNDPAELLAWLAQLRA